MRAAGRACALQLLPVSPAEVTDEQLTGAAAALAARLDELHPAVTDGTLTESVSAPG